jgi:uncharacterized protein
MAMMAKSQKKIFTFLGLVILLSSILYYLIISNGSIQSGGGLYTLGLMWCPGISGIITQLIFEHSIKGMGWKPGKFKYLLLAYLIPLGYCLVVYGLTWLTGLGGVPNPGLVANVRQNYGVISTDPNMILVIYIGVAATLGLIGGVVSGLGEEIGWRGLFIPELIKNMSFNRAMLVSGGIWTLWHLPLILFADYNLPGIPKWYAVIMFAIMVMGISFIFGWLRLKSGSLWPAVILHASHNLFVQVIFTPLTIQKAITPYIIDEFGVGLAIAAIILAIFFIRKARELPAATA